MLTTNEAFRKFKSKLELNQREQDNASSREKEVREYLDTKFLYQPVHDFTIAFQRPALSCQFHARITTTSWKYSYSGLCRGLDTLLLFCCRHKAQAWMTDGEL